MTPARPPLVVAEDPAGADAARAELRGAGWTPTEVIARDPAGVRQAVLAALRRDAVLADAGTAPDELLGDLLDDLGRIAPVLVRRGADALDLDETSWRLLHALTAGATLAEAARAAHVSLRTANRRLTDACAAFGVTSRAAAVRAVTAAGRVPPARD